MPFLTAEESKDLKPEVGSDWKRHYPEIVKDGGLAAAVLANRVPSDPPIDVLNDGLTGYATIAFADRTIQLSCAVQKRLFIVVFIRRGVIFCRIGLSDMDDLRRAIDIWFIKQAKLQDMKNQFPDLEVLPQGTAFESGRGLEFQWKSFLNNPDPLVKPLIEAAAAKPVLRKLFPFRSGNTFRFSRTTGSPYTFDYPYFRIPEPGRYQAMAAAPHLSHLEAQTAGTLLREGTAAEVVASLIEAMPKGVEPATDSFS